MLKSSRVGDGFFSALSVSFFSPLAFPDSDRRPFGMKLKQFPEDFIVEELTDVVPGDQGAFALYSLEKTGLTTHDAMDSIRRRWNIEHQRVSVGGLKDRHAKTRQYFTIFRGPERNLSQDRIQATYLGRTTEPFTSSHIRANRFQLTLRAMTEPELDTATSLIAGLARTGVPNYFDDQRFGSVGFSGEFIALAMIKGDFERALRLALAESYEHDRSGQKKEKAALRDCWGDWVRCKERLERGHARSIVDYLIHHPQDYRGAISRLKPDLLSLYLSAYQSHVWNRLLGRWIERTIPSNQLGSITLALGEFPIPLELDDEQRQKWVRLQLPLPSARIKPDLTSTWQSDLDAILAEDGITQATMKIPGMDRPYFSKGDRQACLVPERLEWKREIDERNAKRLKLELGFELPRGAYATMIVKSITAVSQPPAT